MKSQKTSKSETNPLIMLDNLPLVASTPESWVAMILKNFDEFLLDHAACERKAAALAMSFIAKYPDRVFLIEPMVSLAREELEHFVEVYRVIQKRKLTFRAQDEKDVYVNIILGQLRHGRNERFLDRLVMSGLIEARGWERFHLLSQNLDDSDLSRFYHRLSQRELGHYKIFLNVASKYFDDSEVEEALERLSAVEHEAMLSTPLTARLH